MNPIKFELTCPKKHSILTKVAKNIDAINENNFMISIKYGDSLLLMSPNFSSEDEDEIINYLLHKAITTPVKKDTNVSKKDTESAESNTKPSNQSIIEEGEKKTMEEVYSQIPETPYIPDYS